MKINWKAVREFFIPPTLFESEGYTSFEYWFRHEARSHDGGFYRNAWWDKRFPIVLVEEWEYNPLNHRTRTLKGDGWSLTHDRERYGTAWKLKGDRRRMEEDTMQMMFSI